MNAVAALLRPIPFPTMTRLRNDPVSQVFTLLRIGFVVLPILMGLDKFAEVMNDNWSAYLASEYNDIIPGSAQDAMYAVGIVEILAGIVVLVVPRFGGLLVAGWLAGIIASLLLVGGYGDIALRDFGLLLGALALFRLAGAQSADSPAPGTAQSRDGRAADVPDGGSARSLNGEAARPRDRDVVA
jgi:uncharacterized membrane protein YphA (DoxX/SURF4 family)